MMAENTVLARFAEPAMGQARTLSETSGQTEHVYTDARYAAGDVGARAPRRDHRLPL